MAGARSVEAHQGQETRFSKEERVSQVNVNPGGPDRVYDTDRDRAGWSMGMVLGLVLGLALLAALAWWAFSSTAAPAGFGTDTNVSVTNNTPGGTGSTGTGSTGTGSSGSTGQGSAGSTTGGTGSTTGGTGSTTGSTAGR